MRTEAKRQEYPRERGTFGQKHLKTGKRKMQKTSEQADNNKQGKDEQVDNNKQGKDEQAERNT
jgi:hypothetical protein